MDNKITIRPANWLIDQLNVFQAANSNPMSVRKNFIIRKAEFQIIIDSIRNKGEKDPVQHELILGRRGSGKSTLLRRIEIEITEDKNLNKKFIPINLAEEQAGIYRLFDLWEQVLHELKFQFKEDKTLRSYAEFKSDNDYTKYLYNEIHVLCKKHKRKVVLLLDNIDRIIENFTDDGHLLRETLINYNDIQIIGGSTRMDEHFWRYDMPFYEFFRSHRLESLSREEMKTLLLHWSNSLEIPELKTFIENNPGKLENIRILTDGLPRTLQFFIQMVLQKAELKSYDYLKKIMDNVSPLFQERLNSLTPPLRKTILEMAFKWEACSTRQLTEKVKMESKLVSANLKTLINKGIVEKIGTDTKNHLYRLSERFFNLWIIITQGNPEQKRKAKWLSIFLENFYNREDFKQMAKTHLKRLKGHDVLWDSAILLSKGLSQSKYLSIVERDELIELTESLYSKDLTSSLINLPKKFKEIFKDIHRDINNKNYDNALEKAKEIENEDDGIKFLIFGNIYVLKEKFKQAEKYYLKAIENGNNEALNNLAALYNDQEKFELAEKYYLKTIEKGDNVALNNLAVLYANQEKFELAEKYYLKAIENGNSKALNNLANLYRNQEKFDLAEKYCLKAIENGNSKALFNLALLYDNQEKFDLAEKYYLKAIENGNSKALNNLANLYRNQEKFGLAERYYLKAIENGKNNALFNLAVLYFRQEKLKLAEKYFLSAIENGDNKALNNLAILYDNQEKLELAEKYYIKAIENGDKNAFYNLGVYYYENNKNKEKAFELLQESDHPLKLITAEVWNGIFNDLETRIIDAFKKADFTDLEGFITDMLVHQQRSLMYKLFTHEEIGKTLQSKYMVLYYVVLLLNEKDNKNLKLKIPPELESTTKKILEEIREREIFYGYKKV